jgi:hypothetical protein
MGDIIIIDASLIGKNLFQVKYIKLSYRMRGIVARTQINSVARIIVLIINCRSLKNSMEPENKIIVKSLINKIFAYSAMKISANIPALYSTLKPDTNSDSPSAKSNGVRLVSARFVINHIINNGMIISIVHDFVIVLIINKSMDLWRIRTDRRISDIETS